MSASPVNAVEISLPEDITPACPDDAKISEFEDVASYNWLDESTPTILVPGNFQVVQTSLLPFVTDKYFGTRDPSDVEPTRHRSAPQARLRCLLCRPERRPKSSVSARTLDSCRLTHAAGF